MSRRTTKPEGGLTLCGQFLASEQELHDGNFEGSFFVPKGAEDEEAERFIDDFSMDVIYLVEFKVVAKYVKKGVAKESI